jgi:DNA-binding MarR family transcriptional regulator
MKRKPDLGLKIKIIDEMIAKHANKQLSELGITVTQMHVLIYLHFRKGHESSLKELEKTFETSQATAAGVVVRMEEKEIIESYVSPHDRRVKMIRLTEKGKELLEKSHRDALRTEHMIEAGFTKEEKEELNRLLDILYETIHKLEEKEEK